jgi:hypothetical protein
MRDTLSPLVLAALLAATGCGSGSASATAHGALDEGAETLTDTCFDDEDAPGCAEVLADEGEGRYGGWQP